MPSASGPKTNNHRSRSQGRPLIRQTTKPNLIIEIREDLPPPKVGKMIILNKRIEVDSRVAEIFDRVFAGIFQDIPKPLSKLVRVFTSSTFTDTTIERNALMEEVYPKLKEYCRETHGLDFQVVDMRWGVRDEATDDHMTTQLCINEIANCQRLSVGANFVVFLCQKYGYRPIPSQITSTEMELLKKTLKEDHEDVSILETWYIEDSNSVPPMHVLQPISSILVNFNNKRMPKLQEQDIALWWEAEERMQQLLRRAARTCYEKGLLDKDSMHNYFMSVTEREVIHGILKAKNPNEHCLCYVRHINNIALNQTKTASRFVDIQHNHVNTEAQKLLANLRDERVPSILSGQNIRRSTVDWVGRDGIDGNYHAEYIRQFCTDFYNSVTRMVKQAMEKHSKQRDSMFAEVLQHLHTGKTVSSMFFGRDEQLAVAEEYLKSDSIHPLILQGENGCGKTSTMAKIATMVRSCLGDIQPVVILRFLGTSPDSSNISPLLTTVCQQIAWNYDDSQLNAAPAELSKLFHHFKKITALATRDRPLILIFDSLDLLSPVDGAHELLWLPPTLPVHVKLLVSMNSGNTTIARKMQNMIEKTENYLEVPSLGKDLALRVVKEWLSDSGRTLSDRQWAVVGKVLDKCTLPLFVKLISVTVARWRSYSRIQDTVLFQSVQDSIHALFHRTEAQHGKLLVSHALSYITAARAGISDSEVEDLISLDDKVLDDIYQYHLPPIRRIPPLLWSRIRADLPGYLSERAADGVIVLNWYHEQFRRAAIERYFKNLNHVEQCHSAMAEYFLGVWGGIPKPYHYTEMQKQRFGVAEHEGLADRKVPKQPNVFHAKDGQQRCNTRKLNELPYHLLRAGRADELLNLCLFNYDFMQAKASCFPLQSLILDYEDAIQRLQDPDMLRQLSLVVDALRLSSSLLSRDPSMLSFELLGRLLPLVPSNPLLSLLLIRCDRESPSQNAIIPTHHCFHSPGGPLKFSLEEHMFAVFGMQLSSDKKMLISTSNKIIVWDTSSGDLARVINPHVDGVFFGLSVSADDKWAAAHTNNNQVILASLVTGEFVSIEPETMHDQMELQKAVFTSDGQLLIWSFEQFLLFSFAGKMVQQGSRQHAQRNKIIDIFYGGKKSWQFLLWSGDKDDWTLAIIIDDKSGSGLEIEGAVAFLDTGEFYQGYTCLAHTSPMLKGPENKECPFSLVKIRRKEFGSYSLDYVVTSELQDRVNQILVFPREGAGPEAKWIVAICVELFVLHSAEKGGRVLSLRLPNNVRNIPIKPQHATTAVAFASHDSLFVAGVRKHLYLWDVNTQQLLRSLDAHFGRILNLTSNSLHGQNTLISSSLDHTIKVWNVENIFEKSFSIPMMEQAVERIQIAREKPSLAAVQTRKTVGIWDLKSHRYITSLVANVHGAVVIDSLLAKDGMSLVTVESDNLLLWDLRTQSVLHTMEASGLIQILYLSRELFLGVLVKQVDTPEQKVARLGVYSIQDLSLHYSFEFPCRVFRDCTVLKDAATVVVTTLVKGHDSILAVDVIEKVIKYKFRPRMPKSQKEVVVSRLVANPNNQFQIIVLEGDHSGVVWDMKNRKLIRHLPEFNGEISPDGKLGLHAPVRGGLFIIDMKTGGIIRTLIGNVTEGVNDVVANFTPNGQHVLYYHSGHKTLRVFRVVDGTLIGTFRPHANLTTWACDKSGQTLAIGCQDGSFLSVFIHDPLLKEDAIKAVAQLPSRKHLAEYLHIPVASDRSVDIFDLRNLGAVTTAVAKFKGLIGMSGGVKKSHVCSIQ